MRIAYAIQTAPDPKIRKWFRQLDQRLVNRTGVMVHGRAKDMGKGLYAICIETTVGIVAFLIGPIMFIVSGVAAWALWEKVTVSNWLVGLGLLGVWLAYMMMAPGTHRFLMRITLWRLTGRWVPVKPATQDAIRRVVYGKG